MEYTKPPKTFEEQIQILRKRGLIFGDEAKAVLRLQTVSYYRLSAYMLPFKKRVGKDVVDEFRFGTTFEEVYNLYVFDRKLRLLIFDAIEKIEIAVRTQITYQLSHKYGSHWQDNPSIFKDPIAKPLSNGTIQLIDVYDELQRHINEQLTNNKAEVFIQHYRETYDDPTNPPSWMCVEIMYFNHLSRICGNLRHRADLVGIASFFQMPPREFSSWLHTINYVRNLCAHHARLWNRDLSIKPLPLKFSRTRLWLLNPDEANCGKLYYFLCMINYILQTVNPNTSFGKRLKTLLDEYHPKISAMGFPQNWENEPMWREK